MSGALEKLTAAIEENTATLKAFLTSGAKSAATAAAAKPVAAVAKPAAKGGKKKTGVEDIAKAFGDYLSIKDKDERDARKANVKAIVEYFGAAKATEIDPDNFDEALRYLQQYIDGETPDFDGSGGGEDDALI